MSRIIEGFGSRVSAPRQALFVVLPNADGTVGAISVDDGKTIATLDRPYAAAELRQGEVSAAEIAPDQVGLIFGGATASRGNRDGQFRLYFLADSTEMTPQSAAEYRAIIETLRGRTGYRLEIVGHSDAIGDRSATANLALARAAAIRRQMMRDGIIGRAIRIAGRGDRDPLVTTSPAADQPQNRRVEITIR